MARIDIPRLIQAVDWIFAHYEALYARPVVANDLSLSLEFDAANAVPCELIDLSHEADPEASMERLIRERNSVAFDLKNGCPLTRPSVIVIGPEKTYFFCISYHIIIDGWGSGLLIQKICQAYNDLKNGVEPAIGDDSFSRFMTESANPQSEIMRNKALAFWEPLLNDPVTKIKPIHAGHDECANLTTVLPRELTDKLAKLATTSGATLYHQLLLGWNILLEKTYGTCGATEIPILNRSREYKDTIGFFVETRVLPLPVDNDASVAWNLAFIAKRIREVFRHYHIPADELARLHAKSSHEQTLTASSTISYITKSYDAEIEGNNPELTIVAQNRQTIPFLLYVTDIYADRDIQVQLVHQLAYMNRDEARLAMDRFRHILECIAENPAIKPVDIDMVPPSEKRLISTLLKEDIPLPSETPRPVIFDIVERSAKYADETAVETGGKKCTYKRLIARASSLAGELQKRHGVRNGDVVALLLPRSEELIEAQLAALLLGAAFVPMELHNPDSRLRQICEDSQPKCILSIEPYAGRARTLNGVVVDVASIPDCDSTFAPLAQPDDIAYIIYTSGSTGRPKGVEITNTNLSFHLKTFDHHLRETPFRERGERVLFFASPAFDASIECIFPPLLNGSTIFMAPHPQWPAHELAEVVVKQRLTALMLPPAYLAEFMKLVEATPETVKGHCIRYCICGGEAMHSVSAEIWNRVMGKDAQLVNIYGPTEITVSSNFYTVPSDFASEPGQSTPIGAMGQYYCGRVVDEQGRPVPVGQDGELLIGGPSVAKGYHNMPEATARGFVTLENKRRYYRSGDIVRMRPDGNIVFIRRNDSQVKIRGNRVEIGEIESCIMTISQVQQCAVLALLNEKTRETGLRAFVSLKNDAQVTTADLRAAILARLPDYMVPAFTILPALPVNTSGKIDRKQLAVEAGKFDAVPEAPIKAQESQPQNPVDEFLATLWSEELGHKVQNVRADFFELGGHSIMAARLIAAVNKAFRTQYPFPYFFDKPTIEAMALKLDELTGSHERAAKIASVRLALGRMTPEEIQARLKQANAARSTGVESNS